ncbi:MAG: sel1 repeat family protein [Proteobacteria bacterium]|nr:sel1 repeat family protein [Pseudomonadota bacterium]
MTAVDASADAEWQFIEGRSLVYGLVGPRDLPEGVRLLELSAAQNHPKALRQLALMHFYGSHFPRDPERGRTLLEQSATLGDTEAMVGLGNWLLSNAFGGADRTAAMAWFRKAADAGDEDGQFHVGLMHEAVGDFTEAATWYQMASNVSSDAVCALAALLADGKGVPQDIEEACRLYDWAGDELQDPWGYYGWARLHDDPKYGRQDLSEAAGIYYMAADDGVALAQLRYAELAELGHGVPDEKYDAYVWTRVAMEHLPKEEMARAEATLARVKKKLWFWQLRAAEKQAKSTIAFLKPLRRC